MQCTSPISGWRAVEGGLTSTLAKGFGDKRLTVRCGRCMGCRLHRAHTWAVRCTHEASLYDDNCFATLTYDDEQLPFGNTLDRTHMQLFIKRLRKRHPSQTIRTFYCGEYGGDTDRPHYHALLFNYRPSDPELMARKADKKYYRSDKLDALWGHGHCNFSDVTYQSAAYVAGYITKKITGDLAKEHYQWIDESTGQVIDRQPEFQGQSLKPGIGEAYLRANIRDIYPRSQIIVDGRPTAPPRYYDQLLEQIDPDLYRETLKRRAADKPKFTVSEQGAPQLTNKKQTDTYKGTDRQMICRDKIVRSKQQTRELK